MNRYNAPTKVALPFNIVGLVAFELFAMHFVETKRGLDFQKPGSQVRFHIALLDFEGAWSKLTACFMLVGGYKSIQSGDDAGCRSSLP